MGLFSFLQTTDYDYDDDDEEEFFDDDDDLLSDDLGGFVGGHRPPKAEGIFPCIYMFTYFLAGFRRRAVPAAAASRQNSLAVSFD